MSERDFLADIQVASERLNSGPLPNNAKNAFKEYTKQLISASVESYQTAYQVLGDSGSNTVLRAAVCNLLRTMTMEGWRRPRVQFVDHRKIARPLLNALQTDNTELKIAAIDLIDVLRLKRAVPPLLNLLEDRDATRIRLKAIDALGPIDDPRKIEPLIHIALDQAETDKARFSAIFGLGYGGPDELKVSALTGLMLDATEGLEIRVVAAHTLSRFNLVESLSAYQKLLDERSAKIRFAALWSLNQMRWQTDLTEIMPTVDQILAHDCATYDDEWSLGSEAIRIMEAHWYKQLVPQRKHYVRTYLISPLVEYVDFAEASRTRDENLFVTAFNPIARTTSLNIEPNWFAEKLAQDCSTVQLNVRSPQPQSSSLDWLIPAKNTPLLGSLHQNGYWISITDDAWGVSVFSKWLRGILPKEHTLYLYVCSGFGLEIPIGVEADNFVDQVDNLF